MRFPWRRQQVHGRFLFIIGAMKSGTSSLAGALNKHPDVALGTFKEPHFFAERGSKFTSFDAYRDGWPKGVRYRLDASTTYSKYPLFGDSGQAIRERIPDARYIYLMRDPVDRIESQIAHQVARKPAFLSQYEADGQRIDFYRHALQVSCYAQQLDRYAPELASGRLFLSRFEDMLADEQAFFDQLWAFLEVKAPRREIQLDHRNKRVGAGDVPGIKLSAEIRAMLQEALSSDMARLHDQYGVDVSSWGF